MQKFRDLRVWHRSHGLVLDVYRLTRSFPGEERFGLTSQLRRSSISVPTNIAEGSKRRRARDYARILNIAEGSLAETEYLLLLSGDLNYIERHVVDRLVAEAKDIARMLHALRTRVLAGGS
jgi:four helix bundle protein